MRILELFCGTKSFANAAKERGHEVFTLDKYAKFSPDIVRDILELTPQDVEELKTFRPEVVWASPPCTFFSVASIGKHWNRDNTPKTFNALVGMAIVEQALWLIEELRPEYYFIENPRGKLRKLDIMKDLPFRRTVTYCQYGDTRMKPTDIWTNFQGWEPRPMCKNGDSCHEAAPRGAKTGTQGLKGNVERSVVPPELCKEILISLERCRQTCKTK